MAAKIIVLGSLNGNFDTAFKKVATLHAKQNFSFAIVCGNLFAHDQDDDSLSRLLAGQIKIPLTTYFTVGTASLPEPVVEKIQKDEDICENLHFLGKRSLTKTSEGIRIVSLGGLLDTTIVGGQSKEQHLPFHTPDDPKALRGNNSADILLTSAWPANVWSGSNVALSPENRALVPSENEIAELCATLRPRYHFSTSPADFFYEREPFLHPPASTESDNKDITRFISLAPYGNPAKEKALYAFNLQPGDATTSAPVGTTSSPFRNAKKRPAAAADGNQFSRFGNTHSQNGDGRRQRRRRDRSPPPGPESCFFCLSNPNIDTHMICSIGDDAYVTTAKGPLPAPDSFASSNLSFPGHQLIVPLAHEGTARSMGAEGDKTFKEMTRFKEALQAMVASQSKFKLGAVTWEISRQSGIHLHWQFMPAPLSMIREGLVETAFKVEAENLKYPEFTTTDLGSGANETGDFFRVWLWSDDGDSGIQGKEMVFYLDHSFRFDLQFGRRVMAKLLGLESRIQWRDVAQSLEEETRDVENFKAAFKAFDFTE